MKAKGLIMVAITLLIVGCSCNEENQEKKETIVLAHSSTDYRIEKWQYEGHDYLIYRNTIIHSESCSCKTPSN